MSLTEDMLVQEACEAAWGTANIPDQFAVNRQDLRDVVRRIRPMIEADVLHRAAAALDELPHDTTVPISRSRAWAVLTDRANRLEDGRDG